ncbi:ankyrin repeat domain-containing protein [Oleidesulfovibrio sp.]|uniref:ankyrin repeat domain-containing protein n=1 Tax=Oleidesulfovibrio sp. TaxID=2909707 RepID=UPI003A8B3D97
MKKLLCTSLIMVSLLAGCSKRDFYGAAFPATLLVLSPVALVTTPFVPDSGPTLAESFPDDIQTRRMARAAAQGDIKTIDRLVTEGADVNARGAHNATVLMWTLHKRNMKGFKHLLSLGANPNVEWTLQSDEFRHACSVMHTIHAEYLQAALAAGGNPNLECDGERPMTHHIFFNSTPVLKMLTDHGAELDYMTKYNRYALHMQPAEKRMNQRTLCWKMARTTRWQALKAKHCTASCKTILTGYWTKKSTGWEIVSDYGSGAVSCLWRKGDIFSKKHLMLSSCNGQLPPKFQKRQP